MGSSSAKLPSFSAQVDPRLLLCQHRLASATGRRSRFTSPRAITLDKKDNSVRTWLARHLDLLAAVRLPNNAFKENAGTEVVTDVFFMRKRFEENKSPA